MHEYIVFVVFCKQHDLEQQRKHFRRTNKRPPLHQSPLQIPLTSELSLSKSLLPQSLPYTRVPISAPSLYYIRVPTIVHLISEDQIKSYSRLHLVHSP